MCKELEKTFLPLTRLQFYKHAEWVQCHHVWANSPSIVERYYSEWISEHLSTVSLLWTFWKAFKGLWRWISTAVLSVSAFPSMLLSACSSFCCPCPAEQPHFPTAYLCAPLMLCNLFPLQCPLRFFLVCTRPISFFEMHSFSLSLGWALRNKGTSDVMVQCCNSWWDVNSVNDQTWKGQRSSWPYFHAFTNSAHTVINFVFSLGIV